MLASFRDPSRQLRFKHVSALLLALLAAPAVVAEMIQYTLEPDPRRGVLRVELVWTTSGRLQSALSVARQWGTVSDVPRLIKDVQFEGTLGARAHNARWVIDHHRGAKFTCRYTVDPNEEKLGWDAMHAPVTARAFFHGIGNAFLLVPQAGGGLPHEYDVTLRWKLPDKWQAVCSWATGAHIGARISPQDLRNSVYFAGKLKTRTAERNGRSVTVAVVDRFAFKLDDFADLAANIVDRMATFMDEKDFPPFLVTAVPVGEEVKAGDTRIAGMGLYQSFALFAAPHSQLTDAFEHLFAHELFHYWNGRLLKARQPDKLVYWFLEGFTDYYALRILHETGFWDDRTYAKWVNRHLREYHQNPAKHATNQEILEKYWTERETVGEIPYQRGHLLALRWHHLAKERGIANGLDRFIMPLIEAGRRSDTEVSNETIRRAGVAALGPWFGEEFDRYVREAQKVEVPAEALAPEFAGQMELVADYELGFDRQKTLSAQKVHGLKEDSAAARAGVREGDVLLGWKVPATTDEQVELVVKRDDSLVRIRYYPRGREEEMLQFHPAKEAAESGKP